MRNAPEVELEAEDIPLISNVLVVDDEAVVRDVFSKLLSRESDMVVTMAENAEVGLALVQSQRFDVLITDKNLPGMGGIELIARAREHRPSLEAIMITGYPSAESVIAALAAGASDYLVKPFDDLRLVRAKIRATLERKTQRAMVRERARTVARMASELLSQGRDAPEPAWARLEDRFTQYERAVREGTLGRVLMVGGGPGPMSALSSVGLEPSLCAPHAPELLYADVVVVDTSLEDWRAVVDRVKAAGPDIVLLASPRSDLPELLEALSLHVDLVGFGGKLPSQALADRVKTLLLRRTIEAAQADLAAALAEFHGALAEAPVAVSP
jgi:CheY-like chemotaxis protein